MLELWDVVLMEGCTQIIPPSKSLYSCANEGVLENHVHPSFGSSERASEILLAMEGPLGNWLVGLTNNGPNQVNWCVGQGKKARDTRMPKMIKVNYVFLIL